VTRKTREERMVERAEAHRRDRAHVGRVDADPIDYGFAVSCFCGWEADGVFEEREDAESAYRKHRAGGVS
jgi:hypothetical protein